MKFKEIFPLQVVINLDSRKDRIKECREKEFPKLGISPIRKSGIIFNKTNNSWWNSAIGCMISHYQILQAALLLDTNVFIFEDDISFIGNKPRENLEEACGQIENRNWDMLYMGGNLLKPAYQITSKLAKLTHAQSTSSYGVNKCFIKKLLEYVDLTEIKKPIDLIYAENVIPENNCYITIPMLAIQKTDYSDIEKHEMSYDLPMRRYEHFLRKKDIL